MPLPALFARYQDFMRWLTQTHKAKAFMPKWQHKRERASDPRLQQRRRLRRIQHLSRRRNRID